MSQININSISLSFPHKTCFEDFSALIYHGSHIGIIGSNGSGKSTLLKFLNQEIIPETGQVEYLYPTNIAYIPQIIEVLDDLSGGEKFMKNFFDALSSYPDILLLDEPTNHLDIENRKILLQQLEKYHGTVIFVSHDMHLLNNFAEIIWHIDNENIHIFSGNYNDYMREISLKRTSIESKLSILSRKKKEQHNLLMKEQLRAKKSKNYGEKKRKEGSWPPIIANAKKVQAQVTTASKKKEIIDRKDDLLQQIDDLRLPEILRPKFHLQSADIQDKLIVQISGSKISYGNNIILNDLYLSLYGSEKLALIGKNGSGKTTIVKALMRNPSINIEGNLYAPDIAKIGYLDQHYRNIDYNLTVIENLEIIVPNWDMSEKRKHLNNFLFRKNEEVNANVENLSGGERARLSLSLIASKVPDLLILDEITNNLDLSTLTHVIDILKGYPGALIIISHDKEFLNQIEIDRYYNLSSTSD